MTPTLTIIVGSSAWLIGIFFAWALVHGAQKLRRQEIAAMIPSDSDTGYDSGQATVTTIAPEAEQLPAAA